MINRWPIGPSDHMVASGSPIVRKRDMIWLILVTFHNFNIFILGRCELNKISQISGADISIDWSSKKLKDFKDFRWFIIKGSKEQVKMAKKIMSEKAAEYKVVCIHSFLLFTT